MTTVVREANGLWDWSREHWDPARQMVANPAGGYAELGPFAGKYLIRETAWFALNALAHGDVEVAVPAIETVLRRQYRRPGRPWHGTFPIFDHDPEPGDDAIMWLSYDPNWRQFVGVTLALIVDRYGDQLPAQVVQWCEAATVRCVEGEPPGRIAASYSNPALMHAWLADWVGRRFNLSSCVAQGRALAAEVTALFDATGTLCEFNSPTYDGVNLFAATLWATAEEPLRTPGRRFVDALLDSFQFLYHPYLHSLCGPFTRAYGMDLSSRITLYGLWRLMARSDPTALPALDGTVEHSHDLFFAPFVDWAIRNAPRPFPPDNFDFPRRRSFALSGNRTATALLGKDFMIGAEEGGREGLVWDQYVPGTVHWTAEDHPHWLRVHAQHASPADCRLAGAATMIVRPAAPGGSVTVSTNTVAERRGHNGVQAGARVSIRSGGQMDVRRVGPLTVVSGPGPFEVSVD